MKILAAVAAVITALILVVTPAVAGTIGGGGGPRPTPSLSPSPHDNSRSLAWAQRRDTAIADFQANDVGNGSAHAYALMVGASAKTWGWGDPATDGYLTALDALRNPDGGWGTNSPWDPFGDGTINSADTTYTITIAYQVGPILLDANRVGEVPDSDIQALVDLVLSIQHRDTTEGRCYAYSTSPNDAITATNGLCVHNVNIAVAYFLLLAKQAGYTAPGMDEAISAVKALEMAHYADYWWHYSDRPDPATGQLPTGDADHVSLQAEAWYYLDPMFGVPLVEHMMSTNYTDNDRAPVVYLRLTGLPTYYGDFCTSGDQWLDRVDDFIAAAPHPAQDRRAQAAYYAARNTETC